MRPEESRRVAKKLFKLQKEYLNGESIIENTGQELSEDDSWYYNRGIIEQDPQISVISLQSVGIS